MGFVIVFTMNDETEGWSENVNLWINDDKW